MSMLYNAFRAASDTDKTLDARGIFHAEIVDTLYELEDTLAQYMDQDIMTVDFESTGSAPVNQGDEDKTTLCYLNLLPNTEAPFIQKLQEQFTQAGDTNKIIAAIMPL
jgi:hypothetical protein